MLRPMLKSSPFESCGDYLVQVQYPFNRLFGVMKAGEDSDRHVAFSKEVRSVPLNFVASCEMKILDMSRIRLPSKKS